MKMGKDLKAFRKIVRKVKRLIYGKRRRRRK